MDRHYAHEPLHQMGRPLSRSANQHGQAGGHSQERGFAAGVPQLPVLSPVHAALSAVAARGGRAEVDRVHAQLRPGTREFEGQ